MSAPVFETQTCSRCGGSGNYSFNLMHGSRCYGCAGSGTVYTKRGKAARARFHDALKVEPAKVQPGWLVCWSDLTLSGKQKWVRVADVKVGADGAVTFTSQGGNTAGIKGGSIRAVESLAQRDAVLAEALAYQATLNPKTGKLARVKEAA